MNSATASELVMRCFHARTEAHMFHLSTKSYAKHKALEEFYDSIVDLADSFAEAYQGTWGVLPLHDFSYEASNSPEEMLDKLQVWISDNRGDIGRKADTFLQNLIDEIVAQISQTIYKLTTLS